MKKAESVNISTDTQMSMKNVINSIVSIMDYNGEILKKESRGADVECHNASNKKIKSMIDYQLTPFDKGLKKTIQWYKEHI